MDSEALGELTEVETAWVRCPYSQGRDRPGLIYSQGFPRLGRGYSEGFPHPPA